MPQYANTTDLTGPAATHPDAEQLLEQASRLVRRATRHAVYATDPATDLPTDTHLATAMREATVAQVRMWVALDIDPTTGAAGVTPLPASTSVGGASVQYGTTVEGDDARRAAARGLTEDALLILDEVGLLSGQPQRF